MRNNETCLYANRAADESCTNVAPLVPIPPPLPRDSAASPAVPPPSFPDSAGGGTGSGDRGYCYNQGGGKPLPASSFSHEHASSNQHRSPWPSAAMDWSYRDTPWSPRAPSSRPVSGRQRPKSAVCEKVVKCAIESAVNAVAAEAARVGVDACSLQIWENEPTCVPSRDKAASLSRNTPSKAREPGKVSPSVASRIAQLDGKFVPPRPHSAPPTAGGCNEILQCNRPQPPLSSVTSPLKRLRREVSAGAQIPGQRAASAPPQFWRINQNQVSWDVGTNNALEGDCANFTTATTHCERAERLTLAAESCGEKARGRVTDAIRHMLQKRNAAMCTLKHAKLRHPHLPSAHPKLLKESRLARLADSTTEHESPNSSRLKSAAGSYTASKDTGSTPQGFVGKLQDRVRETKPQKKSVQLPNNGRERRQAALGLKTDSDQGSNFEAFKVKRFHPSQSGDSPRTPDHYSPAHARRRSEGSSPSHFHVGRSGIANPIHVHVGRSSIVRPPGRNSVSNFEAFRQSRLFAERLERENAHQALETALSEFHSDGTNEFITISSGNEANGAGSSDHPSEVGRDTRILPFSRKSTSENKMNKVCLDDGKGGGELMGRMRTAPATVGHRRSYGLSSLGHEAPPLLGTTRAEEEKTRQMKASQRMRHTLYSSEEHRVEASKSTKRRNANRTRFPKNPSAQEHLKDSGFQNAFLDITSEVRDLAYTRECAIFDWQVVELARENCMKIDEVKLVKTFFDQQDTDNSGSLDYDEFEGAMSRLLHNHNEDINADSVRSACRKHWEDADVSQDAGIDFREFLEWFADKRFNEDFLLKPEERKVRGLARKYGISVQELENIKRNFDSQDFDESGHIDSDEFKQILYKILKVPCDVDLPQSRINHFWHEIDRDNSGSVSFEEFLAWWVERKASLTPYEDYYWQIRPVGAQKIFGDASKKASAFKPERGVYGRGCGESGSSDWFYG